MQAVRMPAAEAQAAGQGSPVRRRAAACGGAAALPRCCWRAPPPAGRRGIPGSSYAAYSSAGSFVNCLRGLKGEQAERCPRHGIDWMDRARGRVPIY